MSDGMFAMRRFDRSRKWERWIDGRPRMYLIDWTALLSRAKFIPSTMSPVLEVQPPAFAQSKYYRLRPHAGELK